MTTQTIELIEKRANEMIGWAYMCNTDGLSHVISGVQLVNGKLLLSTNRRLFTVELKDGLTLLNQFYNKTAPPESAELTVAGPRPEVEKAAPQPVQLLTLAGVSEIRDVLKENIRLIRENKEYIPQATAISDSVKTFIELAKVEIRALELNEQVMKNSRKSI